MRIRQLTPVVILAAAALVFSQAPRDTATTMISGKKLSIEYGRPALKGRNFADLMKQLKADRMWRAGSDRITTFTTEADLMIGGIRVAAGKYSLYLHCPESGDYSLVLNSDLGQPLIKVWAAAPPAIANDLYPSFDYDKEIGGKEVVRAAMKKISAPAAELLTYTFKSSDKGVLLTLAWGDQHWAIEIQAAK